MNDPVTKSVETVIGALKAAAYALLTFVLFIIACVLVYATWRAWKREHTTGSVEGPTLQGMTCALTLVPL